MSDCGCGCNGAGDCTDNLNSNAKNAQLTGNINYDGSALACTENSSLNVINGEGLNSIIQKILNVLCPTGSSNGRKLMWNTAMVSGGNALSMNTFMQNVNTFKLSPNSGTPNYLGNGVRVRVSISTKNVASGNLSTLTGTAIYKLGIFGFDGSVKTAYHNLVDITLAAGSATITATSYLLTYEFYRDSLNITSNKIYGYWKLESNDGSVTDGIMSFDETIPFDLTTNKIGFQFVSGVNNAADSIWNYTRTVELIK